MDCASGFLSSISTELVKTIVKELRYPCCLNNFVEDLKKEEGDLIATRDSVQDRVEHAKKQTRKSTEVVDKWLNDANNEADNVKKLLEEASTERHCCVGHCPNWIWRYRLGKKLAKKKLVVEDHIKDARNFIQFDRIATLPSGLADIPKDKCVNFESRQFAYDKLMEAMKDDEVSMIGLYGMGGCGKTTLAMQVGKVAEEEHLFDKVLFVPVSSTVDIGKIQQKIASSLQYEFPENEERERAERLRQRLTQEKRILVILDDVWKMLKFGDIGVPSREDHKGCKVLITTRYQHVCNMLDCQRKIELLILTDDEAWTLFQKQANIFEETSDTIKQLGRKISDECKGLPVAIAAVASSLKDKAEAAWKVALRRLKSSKPVDIDEGLENPYKCLRLSYDNLEEFEEARRLFLLCSVFPEDFEIPIEDLTRYAIGLGVVKEVHSYEGARDEVIAAKEKLISSCLLMSVPLRYMNSKKCVKMHDLVRDVAHWIAKEEKRVIACGSEHVKALEHNSVKYLWCENFQYELDCSNLEFLHIRTELEVSDENLKGMGKLRVLILENAVYSERHPLSTVSFKTLANLRYMMLVGWELSDISFVGDLKKLECLSLVKCSLLSFFESQNDVVATQLTKLRLLELLSCDLRENPFEVIKRIPNLKELYIIHGVDKEDNIEFLNKVSVPQTLQRYSIELGPPRDFLYLESFCSSKTLSLSCFPISNESIKGLAKKAEVLRIGNIKGAAKSIIPDIFEMKKEGINELIEFHIGKSEGIKCLVDTSNYLSEVRCLFSKLLVLKINDMDNLRVLCHGRLPPNGSFKKLEKLDLHHCPKLTSLFSLTVAQSMVQLKLLDISNCQRLKHVLADGDDPTEINLEEFKNEPLVHSSMVFQNLQQAEISYCEESKCVFPQLEELEIFWCPEVDQIIVNHDRGLFSLPSFRRLRLYECPKLSGSLLEASIVKTMTSLEELYIQDCNGLKYIVDGHDRMNWDPIFQRLQKIFIKECDKLKAIFPVHVIGCLPELECLDIRGCRELKQIFEREDANVSQRPSTFDNSITFQRLWRIEIKECHKLEAILPISCLPELKCLFISSCRELKQIFEREDANVSQRPSTFDNSFTFQRLQTIEITRCDKLEAILPISCLPELESVFIQACNELKQIFERGNENVSQRPCFPKLKTLIILDCNNLTALIICGASELQQVFEVPKLKLVVLVQVPRFCQGNELQMQNVKHRFVLNSPNLTSTVHTIEELKHKLKQEEIEDFHYISDYTWAKIETEAKKASESGELPSPQELVDDQSMTRNESSPTNQPMAAAETETIISIPQNIEIEAEREPLSSEVIDNNQSIQRNITGREHEQKRIEREELVSESYNDFLELDREGKRAPHLQPSKQKLSPMSSPELVDQESSSGAGASDQRQTLGETTNIKETGKEKIQEKAAPEGGTIKSLAAGVDGISLGGGVATHTEFGGKDILAKDVQIFEKDDELNVDQKIQKNIDDMIQEGSKSNLADKERRTSVVCNDGVEIPPAFADTGARLGAYKQFVDLDDAQIALLAEAVEAYPHLWNVCNKYSERFQALTVKTLADMLLFLRNESAVSVTPQREKDFHGLCDEAVQLGFDRSWIDQMRQRVVVAKDPKLDDAQTRIRELHMRHAHLTQELHKIKNELKNLQEFVDAQTKCFNFL